MADPRRRDARKLDLQHHRNVIFIRAVKFIKSKFRKVSITSFVGRIDTESHFVSIKLILASSPAERGLDANANLRYNAPIKFAIKMLACTIDILLEWKYIRDNSLIIQNDSKICRIIFYTNIYSFIELNICMKQAGCNVIWELIIREKMTRKRE